MGLIILVIIVVLLSLLHFTRQYIKRKVESSTIELNPELEEKTLLAQKKGILRLEIESGKHKLWANWLENGKDSPSVVIYHGNGESLSDWVEAQLLLRDLGFNSFVFDYTGFGSSEGKPSVDILNQNAISAWNYFCEISSVNSARIAIGHSLGAAILFGSALHFKPKPDRLIVHAPFSTAKEIAVHFGTAKKSWVWMMPDVWNNIKNIKKISNQIPIDIFHSKADQKIPFIMSEKISAHNGSSRVHIMDEFGHNAVYEDPQIGFWKKILYSDQINIERK